MFLFRHAEDLQKTKFVRHVVPIQIVKLGRTTPPFVSASKIMLEIHYQAVNVNVSLQETVPSPKNVSDSNASLFVEKTVILFFIF